MCRRGLNKRGQEGITLTTLLLIVLGVVVVVILILGATGIFGDIFSKREALPGNLEAIAQSCKIAAGASLIADYCYEFKEVQDDEFINCLDPRIADSLVQQGISVEFTCNSALMVSAKKEICKDVIATKVDNTFFNNNPTDNCFLDVYKTQQPSGEGG